MLDLNFLLLLVDFFVSYDKFVLEVREEVSPHDMRLVDIGTLGLAHLDKMINQQLAIIFPDPSRFSQALVRQVNYLLSEFFVVLGFILEHISESCPLICNELIQMIFNI